VRPTIFAMISHGRSGSSMLIRSLGEHSEVRAHGELFHDDEIERIRSTHKAEPYDPRESADLFLDQLFDLGEWTWPSCIGFKLFYNQARKGPASAAWTWLHQHTDVRIIHLLRTNLFESWVSHEVAKRSGEWMLYPDERSAGTPDPFELDPHGCEDFFEWVTGQRDRIRRRFQKHPFKELEYERDLVGRWSETIRELQGFLGLEYQEMEPVTARQRARPVAAQITNYDDLARRWAGSPWSAFMEARSP